MSFEKVKKLFRIRVFNSVGKFSKHRGKDKNALLIRCISHILFTKALCPSYLKLRRFNLWCFYELDEKAESDYAKKYIVCQTPRQMLVKYLDWPTEISMARKMGFQISKKSSAIEIGCLYSRFEDAFHCVTCHLPKLIFFCARRMHATENADMISEGYIRHKKKSRRDQPT